MVGARKIFAWLLVVLWMAFIFYLSHKPATVSNKMSTGITEIIIEVVEKIAPDFDVDIGSFNHIIRKNAHFFAYLVLGILALNGLKSNGISGYRAIGIAMLICVLYAISDEVHQIYIPGRSGQVKDVIIDSAGAVVGSGMYWLKSKITRNK